MHNNVLFEEKQYFRQWWIWLFLILFATGMLIFLIKNLPEDQQDTTTSPMLTVGIGVFGLVLTVAMFTFSRLITVIKEDGIYYRFIPFHFKERRIGIDEINSAYVRKYNPIMEFGGWGIRYSFTGKGRAYNVSGNMGLQIELKNGKKILIGTNRVAEAELALNRLKLTD